MIMVDLGETSLVCPGCGHTPHGARCGVASRMQDGGLCPCTTLAPFPAGPAKPATPGNVPVRPWHNGVTAQDYDAPDTWLPDTWLPDGPCLLYVHMAHTDESRTVTHVDERAVGTLGNQRETKIERALCRALLMHALHLLDQAEADT